VADSTKQRRRLPAEQRRLLILDAAAREFAERGYTAASVDEIATAAGVVKSVVYDHFGSKRELHLALLEQHARDLIDHAVRRTVGDAPEQLLRTNTEAFFEWVEAHPYGWRMLFRDPPADPQIEAAHRQIHQGGLEAIAALVALAPQLDLAVRLPRTQANELIAQTIKSTNDGLAAWWYDHPDMPRRAVAGLATELLWRGLAAIATESVRTPRRRTA
jgi:AcrR family transcriptional regulator